MNLSKFIILFSFLVSVFTLHAQTERQEHHVHSDTIQLSGDHPVGWLHSHPKDNWLLGIQGGGQLYYGFEDRKGPLGDRLTGNIEAFLGHWLFPMVGLRALGGYGTSHGFITLDSYLQNRGSITSNGGFGTSYGVDNKPTTIGGTTIANGALGGYYFPLEGHDDLLIQRWNYLYAGLDIMVNMSFLKRYDLVNLNRKIENVLYLGFNVHVGLSEAHSQRFSDFIGRSTLNGSLVNTNFAAEGHLGYMFHYNLNKHWALNLDARLSLLEGLFDREKIPGVENMTPDINLDIMGGLTYNFNLRDNTSRMKYYVERNIVPYNMDPDSLPRFAAYIQIEESDIFNIVDTLLVYITDTINSTELIQQKKDLEKKRKKLIDAFNNIPPNAQLSSILKKRMLPYEMVFFERDKWDIRPQEEMKIAKMARIMKAFPEYTFTLYGSADSKTGTVKRNWFLSENRADVVFNKLVYEYDIPASQLKREYLGGILDYDPYVLNRTTVIIMDHPAVRQAFEEMKSQRKAGGGTATY